MSQINVHLPYEPLGTRPLLGEPANPNLAANEQLVRHSGLWTILEAFRTASRRIFGTLEVACTAESQEPRPVCVLQGQATHAAGACNLGMPLAPSVLLCPISLC